MKNLLPFICLLILLVIASCADKGNFKSMTASSEAEMNFEPEDDRSTDVSKVPVERKIIKEGDISFETADVKKTREIITQALKEFGGYISKDNVYDYSERIEHRIVIRVQADHFDKLLERISSSAEKLDSKNISAKDVTEEYVDIESRIKTKSELEARYRELLTKATTVEEVLNIEREIGALREEIESIQGRLRYLKDRVSLSTLSVTFYEKTSSTFGFGSKFSDAVHGGWDNLLWLLIGLTHIWPFVLIIGGGVFYAIWWERKKRNK